MKKVECLPSSLREVLDLTPQYDSKSIRDAHVPEEALRVQEENMVWTADSSYIYKRSFSKNTWNKYSTLIRVG